MCIRDRPGAERITTAALAARLEVSEAALYRHFASKAQMFEGLIEFIEQSVFTLVNQITDREPAGQAQAGRIVTMLIQFAEKNPGMTRVMVGDALVYENERLQQRMTQFFDKIESSLKQCMRGNGDATTPTVDAQPVQAMGHEWLMRELLSNLVDNAVKYSHEGGTVTIRCGRRGGEAFLEVEDDGPGVAQAEMPRVLERFYRVQGTQGEGNGLGLAIADEIARLHHSQLQLQPGAGGRGLKVTLAFPA